MKKSPPPDPELITDEFLITRRFRTSDAFSIYIESQAIATKMSCIDTLVAYCEEEDIDVTSAAVLINQSLKDKIQAEGESLNLLKKSSTGLLPF